MGVVDLDLGSICLQVERLGAIMIRLERREKANEREIESRCADCAMKLSE